jgi:hypothetical protein
MSAKRATQAELEQLKETAVRLFAQRKDFRTIGLAIGKSHERARQIVLQALKESSAPIVEEARNRDLELIDHVIAKLVDILDNQESTDSSAKNNAAGGLLKAIDQRAKLLGMHAPTQIEQTITSKKFEDLDAEAFSLVQAAKARSALLETETP